MSSWLSWRVAPLIWERLDPRVESVLTHVRMNETAYQRTLFARPGRCRPCTAASLRHRRVGAPTPPRPSPPPGDTPR